MRRCVWSRNLTNEEAMAHVGPQRHRNNNNIILLRVLLYNLYDKNKLVKLGKTDFKKNRYIG